MPGNAGIWLRKSNTFSAKLEFVQLMASAGLGVPVKLLHESLGHVITVELKTGQLYRGKLAEGMTLYPVI